ncbi:MAG: magnesium transporter [Patescibacteria group bacterium]
MRFRHRLYQIDEETEGVRLLLRHRLPWLIVGLIGGALITIFISRYETVLSEQISLAFFLPFIVYLSDAIGAQTEIIFVRNLSKHQPKLTIYLLKELSLGLTLGVIFGALLALFAQFWFNDSLLAITVGLAMLINAIVATVIGLLVPLLLYREHADPAVGAGPITTLVQDFISIVVYFAVASAVLFGLG